MTISRLPIPSALLLCGLPIFLANCAVIRTVSQAPREDIRFASTEAADTFYQALIRNTTPHNDQDERTLMFGQFMKPVQYHNIDSDNVIFNRASARADTNGSGTITESEAVYYSERTNKITQR